MDKTTLFSTYRQGENRVTASMIAVFERVGLEVVERLLQAVQGESTVELVEFRNQPAEKGSKGTPDASIRASFKYLFETKTTPVGNGSAALLAELKRHLEKLVGEYQSETLFFVTPDEEIPSEVELLRQTLPPGRLSWFSFLDLDRAMEELLGSGDGTNELERFVTSEHERFLLRELHDLFEADGLLGREDVVVVAARSAYDEWREHGAYICQPDRSFRPNLKRMGFYTHKMLRPELPEIRRRWSAIVFDAATADELDHSGGPDEQELAAHIRRNLAGGPRLSGESYGVFLLSRLDEAGTEVLTAAIPYHKKGAWVQGQRYVRLAALHEQPASLEDLPD